MVDSSWLEVTQLTHLVWPLPISSSVKRQNKWCLELAVDHYFLMFWLILQLFIPRFNCLLITIALIPPKSDVFFQITEYCFIVVGYSYCSLIFKWSFVIPSLSTLVNKLLLAEPYNTVEVTIDLTLTCIQSKLKYQDK